MDLTALENKEVMGEFALLSTDFGRIVKNSPRKFAIR
jgi:hypothetical protein